MTTSRTDLPLVMDRSHPLASQIVTQLRGAVGSGVLLAGERLPSTRDLAATLGVSRTVVTTAYAQLFAEGWLEGRHGSGTYVADVTPAPASSAPAPSLGLSCPSLRPPGPRSRPGAPRIRHRWRNRRRSGGTRCAAGRAIARRELTGSDGGT